MRESVYDLPFEDRFDLAFSIGVIHHLEHPERALEKMARALEVPMYRLFHDGEAPTLLRKLKPPTEDEFGSTGDEAAYLSKLCRLLAKMKPHDQQFLLHMAQKAAKGANGSAD